MTSATISSKGQVTIPQEIRDYLNLETGSKKAATLEDMEKAIQQGAS